MKTSFKAKVIIETDIYTLDTQEDKEFLSMYKIEEHINNNKIDVAFINDYLSNDCEPIIVIKLH